MKRELLLAGSILAVPVLAAGCSNNAGDIPLLHNQGGSMEMSSPSSSAVERITPSTSEAPAPVFRTDLTPVQQEHCLEVGEVTIDPTGAFRFSDDAERCGGMARHY